MARSFNGSNQYLVSTGTPVATYPLTMHCRFRPASTPSGSSEQILVSLAKTSAVEEYWLGYFDDPVNGVEIRAVAQDPSGNRFRLRQQTLTNGTWYALTAVFTDASNYEVYVDTAAGTTYAGTSGSVSPAPTDFYVGALIYNTSNLYSPANGDIAEVGIWDAALTAAEVAQLASGHSPAMVRPGNLVGYAPLIGRNSPETGKRGNLSLALVGSPTAAAHPRIINPRRRHIGYDNPAVGGAFKPAWARNSNQIIGAWQ